MVVGALEVRGLSFEYPNGFQVFKSLNAQFDEGEVTAITGPSGRGKSTLLYMLGLMLKPLEGEIVANGLATSSLSDSARAQLRAKEFGFVFQDAVLDPSRTVLDNVTEVALYRGASRREARIRAVELLEQFGVQSRVDGKPGQISGGQAQRIALCRALLFSPRILIADEPTGNLDAGSAQTVIEAFHRHAANGGIVIVASHDASLVAQCSQRIEL